MERADDALARSVSDPCAATMGAEVSSRDHDAHPLRWSVPSLPTRALAVCLLIGCAGEHPTAARPTGARALLGRSGPALVLPTSGCPAESRAVVTRSDAQGSSTRQRSLTEVAVRREPAPDFDGVAGGLRLSFASYPLAPDFPILPTRRIGAREVAGLSNPSMLRLDLILRAPEGRITEGDYSPRVYGEEPPSPRSVEAELLTHEGVIRVDGSGRLQVRSVGDGRLCGIAELGDSTTSIRAAFTVERGRQTTTRGGGRPTPSSP